jgi:hypothetical protein
MTRRRIVRLAQAAQNRDAAAIGEVATLAITAIEQALLENDHSASTDSATEGNEHHGSTEAADH